MVNFINILWALFCQYPFAKILQSQNVTTEKLSKALLYEKSAGKILIKLIPVANPIKLFFSLKNFYVKAKIFKISL